MFHQIPATSFIDGYKLDHISQYVDGTEMVAANMTPRSNEYANYMHGDGKVIAIGIQMALMVMKERWDRTFFNIPKRTAVKQFSRRIKNYVGSDWGDKAIAAMADLHDLQYLPLQVKALPEGVHVDSKVAMFTVMNTDPRFYWLTNFMETFLSCTVWPMCNAACVSEQYYMTSKHYGDICDAPETWLGIANHCFAARGHRGDQDAAMSGAAALMFSYGTDTLWAIDFLEIFYGANSDKELVACSVNAFEHATATQRIAYYMQDQYAEERKDIIDRNGCAEDMAAEILSVLYALREGAIYFTGIASYVADSKDYFGVLRILMTELKDVILARQPDSLGLCKFVLRPDSSPKTPFEVIVGDSYYANVPSTEICSKWTDVAIDAGYNWIKCSDGKFVFIDNEGGYKGIKIHEASEVPDDVRGSLDVLWDIYNGEVTDKGYKRINAKVGLIYGEAITIEMQNKIFERMLAEGYCVSNVLMGVGSWGFLKDSSRDTYGFAIKGTHSIVEGLPLSMQKSPKTAMAFKKSAIGLLRVEWENGEYVQYDNQTPEQEAQGELQIVFRDGVLHNTTTWEEVRARAGFMCDAVNPADVTETTAVEEELETA
jgi:nicotinamide phosphoribosyltransferase